MNKDEDSGGGDDADARMQRRPLRQTLRRALSDGVYQANLAGQVSIGANWESRRQTLSMFSCSLYFVIPSMLASWAACAYGIFFSDGAVVRTLIVGYLGWALLVDAAPSSGARRPRLRALRAWWAHACDYLPLILVKTADLSPRNDYVMGYHPHGIISVGAFCAFATDSAQTLDLTRPGRGDEDDEDDEDDAADRSRNQNQNERGFSHLFPGIDRRLLTLTQNFVTPFLREYILWMGGCDASKESFRNILRPREGKAGGRAVVVVVGGAAESLMVHEGSMDLILERRRGFVREAIMAGAHLVPVLGFGESDLYHVFDVDDGGRMAKFQKFVKRTTGVGVPLFRGRSVFLKNFGVMAMRTPVCVVVGEPIPPPALSQPFRPTIDRKTDEATNEDGRILKEWHAKYMTALKKLEVSYRDAPWNVPGRRRHRSLRIIK